MSKKKSKYRIEFTHPETANYANEIKRQVFAKIGDGVICPCCDQFAKLYRRKLHSGMARALIAISTVQNRVESAAGAGGIGFWVETPKLGFQNGDYGRLRWWELLEQRALKYKDEKEEKRDSGRWRVTTKGMQFVKGEIAIPREVFMYNNLVQGFSADTIKIDEALGKKFNYGELMQPFWESIMKNNAAKIDEKYFTEVKVDFKISET